MQAKTHNGTAEYYVLANNDTIKHGEYQIKAYTGYRILLKGRYNQNKKVGLWKEQYYGTEYKGPMASGYYENDVKTGNWVYHNYKGDTAQIYNWTENKIVFSKLCGTDKKEYTVIENGKKFKSKLDCPPQCVADHDYFLYKLIEVVSENSKLLKKVGYSLYEINTTINVTVDKNSTVTEIAYSTDESNEVKEFIENYIKSYKWIAGKKNDKNVTSKYEFLLGYSCQHN